MATTREESWAPGAIWRRKQCRDLWHWVRTPASRARPIAQCSPHIYLSTEVHADRPPPHIAQICGNCLAMQARAIARRKGVAT
jgi:hypothetical protein